MRRTAALPLHDAIDKQLKDPIDTSVALNSRSNDMLTKTARKSAARPRNANYVVCINNDGYEASLEPRKLYEVLSDPEAQKHNRLRIVEESGDDYVYPGRFFAMIKLPHAVSQALRQAG